jgi:hypothetical protein
VTNVAPHESRPTHREALVASTGMVGKALHRLLDSLATSKLRTISLQSLALTGLFFWAASIEFGGDSRVALTWMATVSFLTVWLLTRNLRRTFEALGNAAMDIWPLTILATAVPLTLWRTWFEDRVPILHQHESVANWAICGLWPVFGVLVAAHYAVSSRTAKGLRARSHGTVVAVRRNRKLGAALLILGDDVSPFSAPRVAEFAVKLGYELVCWEPYAYRAWAERLDPLRSKLRHAVALMLDVQPWDLDLEVTTEDGGLISAITVHRAPAILDRARRRALWMELVHSVVPPIANTTWRFDDRTAEGTVRLVREADILRASIDLADFSAQFRREGLLPDEAWKSFPVALAEDGSAANYQTFQTVIVGQTGSGKGSAVWSIISGLVPSARAGLIHFYAIDPKNSEAKAAPGLFEEIAIDPEGWSQLLEKLVALLKSRQGRGRKPAVTVNDPLILLFIDELSALTMLDTNSRRRTEVMQNLLLLLSQGRSDNILVLAAVQAPMKEFVGQARMFFGMRIAMRTEVSAETDLVLGDGASASGATAHLIPVASEGNGYMSAGTAYMRMEGEATPIRVRFPFTDDDQLAAWSVEFSQLRAARQRKRSASALALHDDDPAECSLVSDANVDEVPDSLWN